MLHNKKYKWGWKRNFNVKWFPWQFYLSENNNTSTNNLSV